MIEADLRREKFSEGEAVELADGQLWHFPRPLVEMRPVFVEGKASFKEPVNRLTFGPTFDAGLEAVWDSADDLERFGTVVRLAADLLRANYELDDEQLSDLLATAIDSDTNAMTDNSARMWASIASIINLPNPTRPARPPLCPSCGRPADTEGLR